MEVIGNGPGMNTQRKLAEKFISCFEIVAVNLDFFEDLDPIPAKRIVGPADTYGQRHWRPLRTRTEATALEPLYAKLAARFPALYEKSVLSHRRADVDLQDFTLLVNPPCGGLEPQCASGWFVGEVVVPIARVYRNRASRVC